MLEKQSKVKMKKGIRSDTVLGYSLVTPAFLIIVIVMLIPMICGIVLSMFNYSIGSTLDSKNFVLFGNYIRMFKDSSAIKAIAVTVLFTVGAFATELILGIFIAELLTKFTKRRGAVLRAICLIPLFVSPIIVGLIWRYMYDPTYGILYSTLRSLHINQYFGGLGSTQWALFCVMIADIWQTTPFVIIVATSGISAISPDIYEAGRIDGAGNLRLFFKMTLPLMKGVVAVICLIRGVDAFRVFDIIYALTGGGPANSTLSLSIYSFQVGFSNNQFGYAMAISIFTMIILFAVFGPVLKYTVNSDD
jgi:multiple sugar transport system permease protein